MKQARVLGLSFILSASLMGCADDPAFVVDSNFKASDTVSNTQFDDTNNTLVKNATDGGTAGGSDSSGSNSSHTDVVAGNFKLLVISKGVSSGMVVLNNATLLKQSDFKNSDFNKIYDIDLKAENRIKVQVAGSPGDQLCVQVYELKSDQTKRSIFEQCADRKAGVPNSFDQTISN